MGKLVGAENLSYPLWISGRSPTPPGINAVAKGLTQSSFFGFILQPFLWSVRTHLHPVANDTAETYQTLSL